jgi:hypothetical protein
VTQTTPKNEQGPKKAPGVRDLKRDKEAMKAIRYLRKKYSVGAVIAVYVCPELDRP